MGNTNGVCPMPHVAVIHFLEINRTFTNTVFPAIGEKGIGPEINWASAPEQKEKK